MATGAPGTNGVWQYGEDDAEAQFSTLLNKAASSADTQIGLDRARLTTLESVQPGTAGHPYREAAGQINSTGVAYGSLSGIYWSTPTTITFPVGRFTTTPIVSAEYFDSGNVSWATIITAPNGTSFSVLPVRLGATPSAAPIHWRAIQMTSIAAGG